MLSPRSAIPVVFGLLGLLVGCTESNPIFGLGQLRDGSVGSGGGGSGVGSFDLATPTGGTSGSDAGRDVPDDRVAPEVVPDPPTADASSSDVSEVDVPVTPPGRLLGHWTFDNPGGGLVARDDSGYAHHGTLEGLAPAVAWVSGRTGGALSVDGQADNRPGVSVAATPVIDGIRAFTIAAWINRSGDANDTTTRAILSRQLGVSEQCVKLAVRGADLVGFVATSNALPGELVQANAVPLLTWTHVVATYDGAVLSLYANGALRVVGSFPTVLRATTTPLYLGTAKTLGQDQPFLGLIDDVAIFGFAMTAAQVKTLVAGAAPSSF